MKGIGNGRNRVYGNKNGSRKYERLSEQNYMSRFVPKSKRKA